MRPRYTTLACGLLAVAMATSRPAAARNILLVILDDVGVDLVGVYGEVKPGMAAPPEHAVTPNISELARHGLLFRNAWSGPLCSPTRATMLTGQYAFRTSMGNATSYLADGVPTVADRLAPAIATRAAIGKWHVTNYDPREPATVSPFESGFGEYRGSWGNLNNESYFAWLGTVDVPPAPPVTTFMVEYATTYEIDAAIHFVTHPPEEPWFLFLGLHAIHTPLEVPPAGLHTQGSVKASCDPGAPPGCATARDITRAMLEAADTELGRLFRAVDLADTTVILFGDNGTLTPLDTAINRANKGGVYEGGINVPLVIAGDAVPSSVQGSETAALAHTVDLFPTILELAGVANTWSIDGKSLVPLLDSPSTPVRTSVYTDGTFETAAAADPRSHDVAVRDARYKLIRRTCSENAGNLRELYDLQLDPGETNDLYPPPVATAADVALHRLDAELHAVTGPDVGPCTVPPDSTLHCGLGSELALLLVIVAALLVHARMRRPVRPAA